MNNYAFSLIRNSDTSNQAAAKLQLRPPGQWGLEPLMDTAMPNQRKHSVIKHKIEYNELNQ